jgi:hypothetical protein
MEHINSKLPPSSSTWHSRCGGLDWVFCRRLGLVWCNRTPLPLLASIVDHVATVDVGTGLHTFVLYLGPYIAKVTMTATECNSLLFARYYGVGRLSVRSVMQAVDQQWLAVIV